MSSIPTIQTGTQHCRAVGALVPVPESANPGSKKLLFHVLYLRSYALLRVTSTLYVIVIESRSKDTTVFHKLE